MPTTLVSDSVPVARTTCYAVVKYGVCRFCESQTEHGQQMALQMSKSNTSPEQRNFVQTKQKQLQQRKYIQCNSQVRYTMIA